VTERDASGGGLTGATGDLTPDTIQDDFDPGERREASDPAHQGEVTKVQASHGPAPGPAPGSDEATDGNRDERGPELGGDVQATEEERL
jgi:hypothetical protein